MNLISPRIKRIVQMLSAVSVLLLSAGMTQAGGLEGLSDQQAFTALRLSSVDPERKNSDRRRIDPGQTLTLGEIQGNGRITHMWFTIWADSTDYLRELVFRVYWDGEQTPAIEAPLGDFFALGFGKMVEFNSAPVATGASRSMNCYWPMPFTKGARFTVTNEGSKPIQSCYYNIDYRLDNKAAEKPLYFHTQYRQAYPAPVGKDYTIAEVNGRGHFVGTFLSVLANSDEWWGEGNDKWYVDGAKTPTIEGTGSEDYFCGAWNFGHTFTSNYCGVPYYEPGETRGIRNTAYRWHVLDPVPFKNQLTFDIEHGRNGFDKDRKPLTNNYSTVAFYYVDHAGKDGPALPTLEERIPQLIPLPAKK